MFLEGIEVSDNICDGNVEGIRLSMGASYNKIFDNMVLNTEGRESVTRTAGCFFHASFILNPRKSYKTIWSKKNDKKLRDLVFSPGTERRLFVIIHKKVWFVEGFIGLSSSVKNKYI